MNHTLWLRRLVISGSILGFSLSANAVEDYYIMAGQSNMVGKGEVAEINKLGGERVQNTDMWLVEENRFDDLRLGENTTQYPGNSGRNRDNFGIEYSFAKEHLKKYPRNMMKVLKYARGGTSIISSREPGDNWNPGEQNNLYTGLIKEIGQVAPKLEAKTRMRCLVWIQGEADRKKDAQVYETHLKKIIAAVKKKAAAPNARVAIVKLSNAGPGTEKQTHAIRAAQVRIARADKTVRLVNADDLPKIDAVHYSGKGLLVLGKRIFRACHQ